ncbi:MAG: hypothetical protein IJT56_11765 [Clostridia bacterium]|nr:hypothetical protein [Clostridia bacterium]
MTVKVYLHPTDPEKYPDYGRRAAKAVTRKALGGRIQFTSLRGFPSTLPNIKDIGEAADMGARPLPDDGSMLKEIKETIDLYVDHFRLGRVLWPVYPTLFAGNFGELVDICAERGLYMFDFWGYVPGSKPVTGIWGEYSIPSSADRYMKEKLGDHFLGYDNGEQDGRYIHASAESKTPIINDRKAQYRQFHGYFEKLGDAMLNHTVTLSSLTYLHYFAKEGNTIMIGAETAQALPSNPMWFSFIRGAAKQYGLLYYGNASVWNRWGYKDYAVMDDEPDTSLGYEKGRTGGTSLSLLRRLIYNQYIYGSDILGFEGSWFTTSEAQPGDVTDDHHYIVGNKKYTLTPIGEIQRYCADFVEKNGSAGTHYAPLAIVADFFSGWTPPRHLYTSAVYRVWGDLPYGEGDHTLDCLFSMLYPGYENAGFYRDERGFMTPTPYGEIADVLLSDVRCEVLSRYRAAIILPDVTLDRETYDKIRKYVRDGGTAVVFEPKCGCDDEHLFGGGNLSLTHYGSGSVMTIRNALVPTGEALSADNQPNGEICHPYRLSGEAKSYLASLFDSLRLIYVSNRRLHYTLAVKDDGEYTLYVANNTLETERFDILAAEGDVSAEEIVIDDGVKGLGEFLPRGVKPKDGVEKKEGRYELPPYDFRMFRVRADGIKLGRMEETNPVFTGDDLYLALTEDVSDAGRYLLDHPTFGHHFAGVKLPASYFGRLDKAAAEKEGHMFRLQSVKVMVDFTRMLDHVSELTIIGNFPKRTERSIEFIREALDKASCYGCAGAIFSLHRNAENEYSHEQAVSGSLKSLEAIAALCRERGVKPYVVNRDQLIPLSEQYAMWDGGRYGSLAYSSCFALAAGDEASLPENAGMLILSDMKTDMFGQRYPMSSPISGGEREDVLAAVYEAAKKKKIPVVLEPGSDDSDIVYNELKAIREVSI